MSYIGYKFKNMDYKTIPKDLSVIAFKNYFISIVTEEELVKMQRIQDHMADLYCNYLTKFNINMFLLLL